MLLFFAAVSLLLVDFLLVHQYQLLYGCMLRPKRLLYVGAEYSTIAYDAPLERAMTQVVDGPIIIQLVMLVRQASLLEACAFEEVDTVVDAFGEVTQLVVLPDNLLFLKHAHPVSEQTSLSEIAWRDAKYAQIHEYLREEYEVAQCFGNLDFKLKFVEVFLLLYYL
ncbi:hypothetical protein LWI28_022829 [Acer negundo]|uniref:Uncharacterized protein n=1 Tax=Acer negundo TaxID=4023 RepID=A0AAD5NN62_ACENE|nr:hypothetical protein LWI28_022829 [Acer negundo]